MVQSLHTMDNTSETKKRHNPSSQTKALVIKTKVLPEAPSSKDGVDVETVEQLIGTLRGAISELRSEYGDKVLDLENRIKAILSDIASKYIDATCFNEIKEKLSSLKDLYDSLSKAISLVTKESLSLKEQHESINKKVSQLESDMKSKTDVVVEKVPIPRSVQMKDYTSDINSIRYQLEKQLGMISQIDEKIPSILDKADNKIKTLEQKESKDILDLKNQISKLSSSIDSVNNSVALLAKNTYDKDLLLIKDAISSIGSRLDKLESRPEQKNYDTYIIPLRNDVLKLRQDLDILIKKSSSTVDAEVLDSKLQALRTVYDQKVSSSNGLMEKITELECAMCRLKKEREEVSDTHVNELKAQLSISNDKIQSIESTMSNTLLELYNKQQEEIKSLHEKLASFTDLIRVVDGHLHIGPDCNIPRQPQVTGKGGVYENAPLTSVIHGGLLLHNAGYTTKKGIPLVYDQETGRILLYRGK